METIINITKQRPTTEVLFVLSKLVHDIQKLLVDNIHSDDFNNLMILLSYSFVRVL